MARRLRRVVLSGYAIHHLVKTDSIVHVSDGVPNDAELVRLYPDAEKDRIVLIFEHDSFDEVREGDVIPTLDVEMQIMENRSVWESSHTR